MPPRKNDQNAIDIAALAGAFFQCLDTTVRIGLERVERERAANDRSGGPGAMCRKTAAAYLDIGTTTLDDLRRAGEIKTITIAGMVRFSRKELDRYITRQEKAG